MGDETNIQWCDATFNPWVGCAKVSPGCANCYAETLMDKRYGRVKWGKGQPRQRTSAANWKLPIKWDREAALTRQMRCPVCGWSGPYEDVCPTDLCMTLGSEMDSVRPRVFCASLADWLDDEVSIEWLADLLTLIRATPNLNWLLLSKRPENWSERIRQARDVVRIGATSGDPRDCVHGMLNAWLNGSPPFNIWLGISAEDQQRWDERVPVLLKIPAAARFVSVEPILGQIDMRFLSPRARSAILADWIGRTYSATRLLNASMRGGAEAFVSEPRVDWIILGGESGPGARPCNVEWIRDGLRQCREAGVKAFVKQLGSNILDTTCNSPYPIIDCERWPASASGCERDGRIMLSDRKGGDPAEWPEDLRVREWPTT